MIEPISAIGHALETVETAPVSVVGPASNSSLSDLSMSFLQRVNQSVAGAESLLQAYAAGENVPTHELMMSFEQAKISLQQAVEVRNRLLDAYQEIMRMQI